MKFRFFLVVYFCEQEKDNFNGYLQYIIIIFLYLFILFYNFSFHFMKKETSLINNSCYLFQILKKNQRRGEKPV